MHQLFKRVDNAIVDNPLFSLLIMQRLVSYLLNNAIQQGQGQDAIYRRSEVKFTYEVKELATDC